MYRAVGSAEVKVEVEGKRWSTCPSGWHLFLGNVHRMMAALTLASKSDITSIHFIILNVIAAVIGLTSERLIKQNMFHWGASTVPLKVNLKWIDDENDILSSVHYCDIHTMHSMFGPVIFNKRHRLKYEDTYFLVLKLGGILSCVPLNHKLQTLVSMYFTLHMISN